jgi:hypothetical protein
MEHGLNRAPGGDNYDREVTQVRAAGVRLGLGEMHRVDLQQSSPPGTVWNRKKMQEPKWESPKEVLLGITSNTGKRDILPYHTCVHPYLNPLTGRSSKDRV